LTVRATSTVDPTKYGTATVTVTNESATVTEVTVSPPTANVVKGTSQTFTASVTGTYGPAQTVTWSVTGGGLGTAITPTGGVLTVAANETATSLTVTATSTVDPTKYGTAIITLLPPALTGAVVITGTPQEGYSLIANTGNLSGSGIISYQWKRASTAQAAGYDIPSATASSYSLVTDDVGQYISVTVTRADRTGTRTSNVLGPVLEAPANTGSVDGTVTINNGIGNVTVSFTETGNLTLSTTDTLTVTVTGSYQAYQWYVDNVLLSSETGGSLTLNGADYTPGTHRILVIVYRNGVPYSQEIRFTVE
jgi:hypothetical protein